MEKLRVLGGYKRILKAAQGLFREDELAYNKFRIELKNHFYEHKEVSSAEKMKELLANIDEAEDTLRNNFVQATRNERGNFEAELKAGDKARTIDPSELDLTK